MNWRDGSLRHLYWGAPLWRMGRPGLSARGRRRFSSFDVPHPSLHGETEEFTRYGAGLATTSRRSKHPEDGNRDMVLR